MDNNALIDPFKRRIEYLRLSVTDLCNYKCVYCLPNGYQKCETKPSYLTTNEIRTLIQAFSRLGTKKVRLSGGEPTLRKDLIEIVQICAEPSTIQKVALTTNGYQLEKLYKPLIQAGISQFNVSIDSFDQQQFKEITGKKKLHAILDALHHMLDEGIFVKLNAVLMRNTHKTIVEDTLAFIKTRPVTMRFIELMRTGDNASFYAQEHISAQFILNKLLEEGWLLRERSPMDGPAKEFTHPNYQGSIGIIAPYSKHFCQSCNRLRVTSLGQLHLCLFDSLAYNLRPWLTAGDVDGLQTELQRLINYKPEQHRLHNDNPGIMKFLAQIGG